MRGPNIADIGASKKIDQKKKKKSIRSEIGYSSRYLTNISNKHRDEKQLQRMET